jgi:hypothetical protein
MPDPAGAGWTRRPIVAENGFVSPWSNPIASPVPTGRSTQIGVASLNVTSRSYSSASRLDHLLLHLAVERDGQLLRGVVLTHVDQRVLLGELRQRDAQRQPVPGATGSDDRLQRRRGEVVPSCVRSRRTDRVADPDLAQPPELPDLARA